MPAAAVTAAWMRTVRSLSSLSGEKPLTLDTDSADGSRMMRSHGPLS